MKTYQISVKIKKPFGNLERQAHVLIVVRDPKGRYLVGCKPQFYPSGICRLIGGGIKKGESWQAAAVRELAEELGVEAKKKNFKLLGKVVVEAKAKKRYRLETFLCFYQITSNEITPGGDIREISFISLEGLRELGRKLESLAADDWFIEDGKCLHSWGDYGKVYGPIHEIAYQLMISYGV